MFNIESGIVAGIILISFGVLNCFFGYKLFKVLLAIGAFIIGGYMCGRIAYSISGVESVAIVIGIIGGIIIAIIIFFFYYGGIFLIGATFGAIIGMSLNIGLDNTTKIAIIIILAIAGGILALIFQKFMIIISTAFSGAYLLINGLIYSYYWLNKKFFTLENYFKFIQSSSLYIVIICISLILGVFGIIFQYKMHSGE